MFPAPVHATTAVMTEWLDWCVPVVPAESPRDRPMPLLPGATHCISFYYSDGHGVQGTHQWQGFLFYRPSAHGQKNPVKISEERDEVGTTAGTALDNSSFVGVGHSLISPAGEGPTWVRLTIPTNPAFNGSAEIFAMDKWGLWPADAISEMELEIAAGDIVDHGKDPSGESPNFFGELNFQKPWWISYKRTTATMDLFPNPSQ